MIFPRFLGFLKLCFRFFLGFLKISLKNVSKIFRVICPWPLPVESEIELVIIDKIFIYFDIRKIRPSIFLGLLFHR